MNNFFTGGKTTLFSSLIITSIFVIMMYSQNLWLPWQHYFVSAFQIFSLVVVLFSAQFNQSRFSLLSLTLFAFWLSNEVSIPILSIWQNNIEWQILTSLFIFTWLAFIKDRGLLSIHSLYRVIVYICAISAGVGWLYLIERLQVYYPNQVFFEQYLIWLQLYLPIAFCLLAITFASLIKKHLFQPAVLVTAVLTALFYFNELSISWLTILLVLSVYFLLSVIAGAYFLAYRDELTGLPSRRALYQMALSLGRKYSVAMMDIDHFKKFNDTYGHDVGDQVLKLVATKLAKVKSGGRVFRYGGEEFTVIFPRKNAEQTFDELEKLRESIASYKIVIRQPDRKGKENRKGKKSDNTKTVSVTISIGVASRLPKQKFDQVMKASDEKLYKAKHNGRNNVTM